MENTNETNLNVIPVSPTGLSTEKRLPPYEDRIVEPEWVVHYHVRRRGRWLRWLKALATSIVAIGVAAVLILIPTPFSSPFQNWKNAIIVFVLVCYLGKTLLDTLFYNHYTP
jgi:hypothetical protein